MAEKNTEIDNFINLFLYIGLGILVLFALTTLKFRDFTGAGIGINIISIISSFLM